MPISNAIATGLISSPHSFRFISTIFNVALEGEKAARVSGHLVSPEYFSVLGIQAAQGRVLSPDLDKPGEAPVVVISDRFWRTRLDSDPRAVGRSLRVNGQLATIVGIGPADFFGVMPYPNARRSLRTCTLGRGLRRNSTTTS